MNNEILSAIQIMLIGMGEKYHFADTHIMTTIQIMLIGMGVVVLFLIILVYVMKFVSVVVAQINKIMPPQEEAISSAPVQSASGDKMKAIAIALAHIHSNKK